MRSISNLSRGAFRQSKLQNHLIQIHPQQFCVSQELQNPKMQEMSNQDDAESDDESNTNPLLQTLSDSELFQTIKPSSSAPIRHSTIEFTQWERNNRTLPNVNASHQYAAILNAKSVQQIYSGLETFREKVRNNSKQKLLHMVDTIGANEDDIAKSDAKLNARNDYRNLCEANCKAIHVLGYLKEYDEAHKLFEDIKSTKFGLSPNVFAAAIWLTMERNFNKQALNECFEIKYEMEDKYKLKPSAKIYQTLITNALDLREFKRAKGIVKSIMNMDESEKQRLLRDYVAGKYLRIAIIRFYSSRKQINNALMFMDYLIKTMGKEAINSNIYSSMLSCVTELVKDGDTSMVEIGEKLFKQSFEILERSPEESVFLSLMNMYSYVPDYRSVMDMVEAMRQNPDWPNPTSMSYSVCLKALNQKGQESEGAFSYEEGWNEVDKILGMMEEDGVRPHQAIYSLLFNLCSGRFCGTPDLNKLYKYYEEMMEKDVKLNPSGARNLLLSGVDYYLRKYEMEVEDKEKIKGECMKFVDWAMTVYKRHNLDFIHFHQISLQHKLDKLE